MDLIITVLRVIHVLSAILMAWPFYALVIFNQRTRLGPPIGGRIDILVENIIKNRTKACFVFQGTMLVTGLAIILLRGFGLGYLLVNPVVGIKFLLLIMIASLLAYVHLRIQPEIDQLLSAAGEGLVAAEPAKRIVSLRRRRKFLASICIFSVLTMALLGLQVYAYFPVWLTLILLALIAALVWRAYSSQIPYGWF